MKTFAYVCLSLLTLFAVAPAKADGVFDVPPDDPRIILAGSRGSMGVGENFTFGSEDLTSITQNISFIDLKNISGDTFGNLVITITNASFGNNLTCAVLSFFTGCSVDQAGTTVTFQGLNGENRNGIPSLDDSESEFLGSILNPLSLLDTNFDSFDCNNTGHFVLIFVGLPADQPLTFQGAANVAEPGSLLLCLAGLGLFAVLKKR